ncbi:MAG: hypothetical protein M1817_002085 [Caeruleum heppii]|nr:MAG: hypothetical protein M1817_002085 [Caeruleum heppii]
MATDIQLNTPLADALTASIQPKLSEVGWSTGGADDSALTEYIMLMLVNGKTQDQIAAELSGDLLQLGPDDPGAIDFSRWLFAQVELLQTQLAGGAPTHVASEVIVQDGQNNAQQIQSYAGDSGGDQQSDGTLANEDTEMGDGTDGPSGSNIPTGPRSMRGSQNKRLFGQLSKAMDRSSDAVLHRKRTAERVNSHSREPPRGPRNGPNRMNRPPPPRPMGGMSNGGMMPGAPSAALTQMTPQQQMQLFAMYEEQARMMSQILSPHQQQQMFLPGSMPQGGMMNGFGQTGPAQQPGRSLFDRVQEPQHRHQPRTDKRHMPKGARPGDQASKGAAAGLNADVEMDTSKDDTESTPATTMCKFNLSCTKVDCPFAHQSPAAPPGTTVDMTDECSFGAACKNRKCVGRHPSPATKVGHQAEQDCKFFPNCTNAKCPFRHPTLPLCRNGADCTREGCKFTHVKTVCKFDPCLNPSCPFKHADGQKRGAFHDKVWKAPGSGTEEHVSERKFVDETAEEELIIPTSSGDNSSIEVGLVA